MIPQRMEKVTYTPAEFAEVFGRERTWAYRQLYAGKVQAITELGRTLIPKSEVDRLLGEVGRYLGAKAKTKKDVVQHWTGKPTSQSVAVSSWAHAIMQRKKHGLPPQGSAHSGGARKLSSQERPHPCDQATSRQSVYQRLTRYKSSRKDGGDRDG